MKKQTVNSNKSFSSFIFGENSLLIQCSEILLEKGHKIYGIVTSDSKIVKWAAAKKITIIDSNANPVTTLNERPFDFLFSIANLSILSDEILELPRKGSVNFHDGPLPEYAGINTPSWAILNREKHYGITWHMMSREVDRGDILKQVTFDIDEEETALTLNAKCFEAASNSFAVLVDELSEGTNKPQKQNFKERTYYSRFKRPANGCIVSWNETAEHISTFCRALDFGPYSNPLGSPKIMLNSDFMIIGEIEVLKVKSDAIPGTITRIEDNQIRIATNSQDVALRKLMTIDGLALPVSNIVKRYRLTEGSSLERLGSEDQERITCFNSEICKKEAFWVRQLEALNFVDIHYTKPDNSNANLDEYEVLSLELPTNIKNALTTSNKITDIEDLLLTAFCLYIGQLSRSNSFTLGYSNSDLRKQLLGLEGLFATHLPLQIQINESDTIATSVQKILNQIEIVRQNKSYIFDISTRYPQLDKLSESDGKLVYPIVVERVDQLSEFKPQTGCILTLVVLNNLSELHWVYNPLALSQVNLKLMQTQFLYFLNAIFNNTENKTLAEISLITPNERNKLIQEWNNTRSEYEKDICIHKLFEAQVEMSPDDIAVFCNGKELTYCQLNGRANQLANYLRKLGVGPEVLVGVCLHRSINMMVAIYGILKAGGAYVPLDPGFPKDRLKYMLVDSCCKVLLTEAQLINDMPVHRTQVVAIDSEWLTISKEKTENIDSGVTSENLSYVIYTSGTTGQPKGVMVNHKNVVNFFTGMDKHVLHNPPGVWLAVTSLSFDISVLELFWTLARGFKVVLYAEEDWKSPNSHTVVQSPDKSLDFSLFYFSSSERDNSENKYQLLLEGAKFGDKHGFKAVWTPERHFHEFGGLYPNPSVTSAALATITNQIQLRCGSCVSPLHSPIRIAEEWSVVDNLSNGRIGISFAAGWQPNDFVFRPGTYEKRKEIMFQQIETVQKLWRGETVQFQNGTEKIVDVKTLPRPIQKELPIWITAANNPETFRMAGERGFHLLTHLLGQSVDELSEKVAIYRKAWNDGGHARDKGVVTLMLHTFIGRNLEEVREIVREPMKQYLASAINLVELASWYFPTHKKLDNDFNNAVGQLTDEDKDAILNHAFERYFNTSSLIGTPESCLKMIDKIIKAGVDEVGCLIDFGVKPEIVLNHLHYLNTVKMQANINFTNSSVKEDYSIPALIEKHNVTHIQCTPSMAKILTANEISSKVLKNLQYFIVGGESLSLQLSQKLTSLVNGSVINMYGPTETTIWSTVYHVNNEKDTVPIGRPISNTEIYILNDNLQLVPVGVPGELHIGGDGVVRGYLNRPELTEMRFIPNPFRNGQVNRLYRTGDLARFRLDGNIEFLGRLDHQVKIRGYRIELGEIETSLEQISEVQEAVTVAPEDAAGDKRLVAYLVLHTGKEITVEVLRSLLLAKLPEYMVPSAFVFLKSFPLTPNGKINRRALPAPKSTRSNFEKTYMAPRTSTQKTLAKIWHQVLGISKVGLQDKFLDLGGHSLSAVQIIVRIRQTFNVDLPLQTFFDSSTLAGIAEKVEERQLEQETEDNIKMLLNELEDTSGLEQSK